MTAAPDCPICGHAEFAFFCTAFDRVRRDAGTVWKIERCRFCGYGRTVPALEEREIAAHYPPGYLGDTQKALEDFLAGRLQKSRVWRSETEKADLVGRFLQGGSILDVGCGDGRFLWTLDSRHWLRVGLDLSDCTLAEVRAHIPGLRLLAEDIRTTSIENESLDAITFWHSLEHLPDPHATIARVSDLLRPGGWLFISLPGVDSLQARIFRRHWYPMDDVPRHIHHFSRRALDMLLARHGFVIHSHVFFSRRIAFHSLKHSLRNWIEDRGIARGAYYLLKPGLFPALLLEWASGRYGILTAIARRP